MKMNVDIHTKVRKSLCLFTLLRWGRVKWSQLLFFGLFFALFGPVSSGISQAESLAEPQKLATLVSTALGVEHSLVLFFFTPSLHCRCCWYSASGGFFACASVRSGLKQS